MRHLRRDGSYWIGWKLRIPIFGSLLPENCRYRDLRITSAASILPEWIRYPRLKIVEELVGNLVIGAVTGAAVVRDGSRQIPFATVVP